MMTDIQTQASEIVHVERKADTMTKTMYNDKTTQIWLFEEEAGERVIGPTKKKFTDTSTQIWLFGDETRSEEYKQISTSFSQRSEEQIHVSRNISIRMSNSMSKVTSPRVYTEESIEEDVHLSPTRIQTNTAVPRFQEQFRFEEEKPRMIFRDSKAQMTQPEVSPPPQIPRMNFMDSKAQMTQPEVSPPPQTTTRTWDTVTHMSELEYNEVKDLQNSAKLLLKVMAVTMRRRAQAEVLSFAKALWRFYN